MKNILASHFIFFQRSSGINPFSSFSECFFLRVAKSLSFCASNRFVKSSIAAAYLFVELYCLNVPDFDYLWLVSCFLFSFSLRSLSNIASAEVPALLPYAALNWSKILPCLFLISGFVVQVYDFFFYFFFNGFR